MLGNRAGDGQPLFLPAGDIAAALGNRGVVALGLGRDKFGGLGNLSSPAHVGVGDVVATKFQVGINGAAEQHTFLRHVAQLVVQLRLAHIAHIDAVDRHTAFADVVKTRDEVEQRRFAAACGADDGRRLPGFGGKADMLQRVLVRAGIAEANIVKGHNALGTALGQGFRRGRVVDGSGGLDDLVDAVCGHTRAGQHDGDHRQH